MTKAILVCSVLLSSSAAFAEGAFIQDADGHWHRNPHACGTPQYPVASDQGPALPPPHAPGLRTVYLNKNGGTYTRGGGTNSSTNTVNANIIPGNGGGSFTIPPISSAFNWPNISACVREHFERYNIRVVETEPTSGMYIEAVVGGNGSEIGFPQGQLFGIASADNFCGVTERGIAFNFSEPHRQVPRSDDELCATIAHEVGHLIALEHEQLGIDIMSYVLIAESNTKAFVDQNSGCGTSPQDPSGCTCSGSTTNSHQRLVTAIGLRPIETVPPNVNIDTPTNALQVPPTFEIVVTATDDMMMSDVRALIDDVEVGSDSEPEGNKYSIIARGVEEGEHELAVIGTDAAGNEARKEIAIVVRLAQTGDACVANEACAGGICAIQGDSQYCSQTCSANDACPDGFDCVDLGNGSQICAPAEGGGCCSASGDPGATMLMLLGVGLVVMRRRRR